MPGPLQVRQDGISSIGIEIPRQQRWHGLLIGQPGFEGNRLRQTLGFGAIEMHADDTD